MVSSGNLRSLIPLSCAADPSCFNFLILDDPASGSPATAIHNNTYDFSNDPLGKGSVSASNKWLVKSPTKASLYSYNYFYNLASGKTFTDLGANPTITTAVIASTPANTPGNGGYAWIKASGNVSLGNVGAPPQVLVNKKVILFVDGNLTINDEVIINNLENDFFMAVVSGDIDINPALVSLNLATPVVTGIFAADGTFSTGTNGTDDGILVLHGSVAAGNFNLERNLNAENVNTPAEHFIYSPPLIVNYPSALSEKHLIWREVAP